MVGMSRYPDKYFELAIVDPPYGIGENGERNVTGDRPTAKWKNPKSQHYKTFDDSKIPDDVYFKELFRVSKNQIVFGGNYFTEYLPPKMGWILWDKGQRDFSLADGELAWTSFDETCKQFNLSRVQAYAGSNKIHPTEKPIKLYDWCLNKFAKEGNLILGPVWPMLRLRISYSSSLTRSWTGTGPNLAS